MHSSKEEAIVTHGYYVREQLSEIVPLSKLFIVRIIVQNLK